MSKVRKVINVLSTLLLVALVIIVIFVFISRISGKSPSLFGYHIFRVSSGSMEPTLLVGDVILVKEVDPSEIHEGDIITYNGKVGDLDGKTVTHMVVEEPYVEGSKYHIQTRGIVSGAVNDPAITEAEVEGKYIRTIPFINHVYTFFLSPYGLIVFVFIIIALFGYEMISLILSYRYVSEHDDEYYEPKPKKKSKKRKK